MRRVLILGPGASGKSTLAIHLGEITGLPVIELDKLFWRPGLAATPHDEWVKMQERLVEGNAWIIEGDLGPYDAVEARLHAADTIVFLDFSPARCAWRAVRRSRERADFWLWLLRYRRQSRPILMDAIARYAAHANLHVLRNPAALTRFIELVRRSNGAEELYLDGLTTQDHWTRARSTLHMGAFMPATCILGTREEAIESVKIAIAPETKARWR